MSNVIELDPRGRTSRAIYLLAGLLLFATKYPLDNLIARGVFNRPWSLVDYLAPGQAIVSLITDRFDRKFFLTMSGIALPYILVGLALTTRRLRDAGLPMWLVMFFFMPLGNLFFFLMLALIPSRPTLAEPALPPDLTPLEPESAPPPPRLEYGREVSAALFPRFPLLRWWPADALASEVLAVLLPVPLMLGVVMLATHVLRDYGWGLFIGLPFVNGMLCALLHGTAVPRRTGQSLHAATLGVIASATAIFAVALEGLGCLVMFLPLAIPIALAGGALGHAIQARPLPRGYYPDSVRLGCPAVLMLAMFIWAEQATRPPLAPQFAVTTTVEIDAPPEVVWQHVIAFPDLPPPTEFLFRHAGVAYPIRARIDGVGRGAVRYCEFSTGPFVEPITAWEPGRLLKFDVTRNPAPMREYTFYPNVHPPHLDNFLASDGGEFRLTALPGGRTRVEGTTWYRHHMWPVGYWRLWSDMIIHRIHARVLTHVKQLAEHP